MASGIPGTREAQNLYPMTKYKSADTFLWDLVIKFSVSDRFLWDNFDLA